MSVTARDVARIHRLTVDAYHRMGEAGILPPDLRTELIDGQVIETAPIGHAHSGTVNLLANRLKETAGPQAIVAVQNPIVLGDYAEPQPDIALLRPRPDYYRSAHPRPENVLLLIEVADTSLCYDREVKLPLYAQTGIPEVWLVDLSGHTLTAFRNPAPTGYQDVTVAHNLTNLVPARLPHAAIDLSGLF
jgi:Uma2 family endonuclease